MADVFIAPAKNKQKTNPPAGGAAEKSELNPLCSYCLNPKGIKFQTQKETETIILFFIKSNLSAGASGEVKREARRTAWRNSSRFA